MAFLVALSAASGCGLGADPFYGEPALPAWKPLSEETRRSLGTVQVVPRVDRRPSPSLRRPWVKSEASARLALKATGMTVGVAALCPPVIFMLPVMAGMGAVGGMNVGMSDRTVAAQKRRISAALLAVEPERRLASALIARSNSSPRGTTRLVAKSPAGGAVAVPPSPAPDALLELTVWRYGLRGDDSVDPELEAFLVVSARLFRATDGRLLHSASCRATGKLTGKFRAWDKAGMTVMAEEFDGMIRSIADRVESRLLPQPPISP